MCFIRARACIENASLRVVVNFVAVSLLVAEIMWRSNSIFKRLCEQQLPNFKVYSKQGSYNLLSGPVHIELN